MKRIYVITIAFLQFLSCQKSTENLAINNQEDLNVACIDNTCSGQYKGPEFIGRSDIAHQFSNTMSRAVGDYLKQKYRDGTFYKVDFPNIKMTTEGMGSGEVTYALSIPFIEVSNTCEAYTSFDHVGGWNHTPALSQRKKQLQRLLITGQSLDISDLKTTAEGLQEYWIQWKHKEIQKVCK